MAEQPRREEGRSGQRDHGNLRQHHDSPNDCQPRVRRQDCLRAQAQDVLAPEPGKGQEGRHAGKDHLRVLLPAHVEGAWGDLHLQPPVPAGVRGCRGRRDGEAGVAFGCIRGGAAPPHQRRDRRGAAARGRRAHRARTGG